MAKKSKAAPKNLPASVMARLRNEAIKQNTDVNQILTHYALERLLYRIANSSHANRFILKGAFVYIAWLNADRFRPTGDLDLLGTGENEPAALTSTFAEIISTEVPDDGLEFDDESIASSLIREGQQYEGVRVSLTAHLGRARIPVLIDIGFGDVVSPEAEELIFPVLLDAPAPVIRAYPKETVLAEKLEAMVSIGRRTSRMKDFYDLLALSRLFTFTGASTSDAIKATFERRQTALPKGTPAVLKDDFGSDRETQAQWNAFVTRSQLLITPPELPDVLNELQTFLLPVLIAAEAGEEFDKTWEPNAGWT